MLTASVIIEIDGVLPEIVEYPDHPWFIGVQYHPELKSKPFAPHPLFEGFIAAAVRQSGSWWEDWTQWAASRSGDLTAPPPMGSTRYPPSGHAPGDYIRG